MSKEGKLQESPKPGTISAACRRSAGSRKMGGWYSQCPVKWKVAA
jgi:hypothetical protein